MIQWINTDFQCWEVYIYKSFVKNPPLWGAPQVRYMPLVLSSNSERLFRSYGSFYYKIPHVTETVTSNHALFLIYSTAVRSLWDMCNAFQQVLVLFLLGWAWEDTHKHTPPQKKKKGSEQVNSWLACSASMQGFSKPP